MTKLLISVLALLLLVAAALFAGKQALVGYLTPDFLARQIESRWNCRAQVESVRVSLIGSAAVTATGVALAPRDRYADEAVPLADRPPLEEGAAEIRLDSVLLVILPAELIRRNLSIRQLVVDGAVVNATINREGGASVQRLFDQVAAVPGRELPLAAATAGASEGSPDDPESGGAMEEGRGKDLSLVAERIEVNRGEMALLVEASGARILLDDFQLALAEIDVDPHSLASRNRALLEFSSRLRVSPPAGSEEVDYLDGRVSGAGRITPFDAESGRFDPVWTADLTLHEGSRIADFPVLETLRDKLGGADTSGLDLSDVSLGGLVLADATTQIGHAQGRYLVREPLDLALADTVVTVHKGSWIHTGTNQHRLRGRLSASEVLTAKIEAKVDAFLQEKAGGFAVQGLGKLALSPVTENGRLTLEFTSQGDLGEPKADIVTRMGNLSELLGTGKETIKTLEEAGKGLLRNLFGN